MDSVIPRARRPASASALAASLVFLVACGGSPSGPDAPRTGVVVRTASNTVTIGEPATVTIVLGTEEDAVRIPLCDGRPEHGLEIRLLRGWDLSGAVHGCDEGEADSRAELDPGESLSFSTENADGAVSCGGSAAYRFRVQIDPSSSSTDLRSATSNTFGLECS